MSLPQILRAASRSLVRTPSFALTVALILALGLGLSIAVFAVAAALLLRRLPVANQDRLIALWGEMRDHSLDNVPLRFNDARALARQRTTLQSVALFAYEGSWPVTLRDDQRFLRLRRSLVSGNYFDVLGAQPVLGRALRPSDDVVGAAPLAVLSYKAWRGSFGGTQAIVGHRLTLEETGVNCAVAGWRAHRYASRAESGGAPDHHPSLVTLDQSLRFQQNLAGRAIAVLVIRARSNRMADLEPLVPEMLRVLPTAPHGQATLVGT